jgi:hypothetical protein
MSITDFRKEYIWGFTQGHPMRHSTDKDAFYKLIHPLTGDLAAITIGASFHPYQLLNGKDVDIWEDVYTIIEANKYCDMDELVRQKMFFHMNPPGVDAFPIRKWRDTRLFHEVNPEFSKLVPFVIPYLVYNDDQQPLWLTRLHEGILAHGHAQEFITATNNASRFLMPDPTFIIGFEEFHAHNPGKLINHFVDFLDQHLRK